MRLKNFNRVFPTASNVSHYQARWGKKHIDIYFNPNNMETTIYSNGVKKLTGIWDSDTSYEIWLNDFIEQNW